MEDTEHAPGVLRKNLDRPDDDRAIGRGRGSLVEVGLLSVGRAILPPGWRWSLDVRPVVGTALCEIHHLHVLLAGRLAVQMASGELYEFVPNDVMDIPPGHDAWVVGDEEVVLLDVSGNVSDFGFPVSSTRVVATMLMTDIVGSTAMASRLGDAAWKQRLADHNRAVRRQLENFKGREINTTGDGFLAIFDSARAALLCGIAACEATRSLGVEIRVGVHTGEVELVAGDVRGIAVHAVARVMGSAGASEVFATAVTRTLAEGSGLRFEDRGRHELKGLESPLELYAVSGA